MRKEPLNSSTSNSDIGVKYPLPWYMAFAAVVFVLAPLEVACHLHLVPLSSDYKTCWSFPARGANVAAGKGIRIAVIGNSAARMGVNPDVLKTFLAKSCGSEVCLDRFTIDGSRVTVWNYILAAAFWRNGVNPDAAVIIFQPGALEDGGDLIPPIAQGLTGPRDWPEVFQDHLPSASERIEFAADSVSALYASRAKWRDKALHVAVPGYGPFATTVNRVNFDTLRAHANSTLPRAGSYHSLKSLLANARRNQTRLIFVLYPEFETDQGTRSLNRDAIRCIQQAGFEFVDLSTSTGLVESQYVDKFHMSPEAAAIFTVKLGEAITPLVKHHYRQQANATISSELPDPEKLSDKAKKGEWSL